MALGHVPLVTLVALQLHRRISWARVANTRVPATLIFIVHMIIKPLSFILAYVVWSLILAYQIDILDTKTISVPQTMLCLNSCLNESREGVGGTEAESGGMVGIGGLADILIK